MSINLVCVRACMCVCLSVNLVCVHACVCVCVYMCIYVCACLCSVHVCLVYTCNSCNTGMSALPDMYARLPEGRGQYMSGKA